MNWACNGNFFCPAPGAGSKGQISLNFKNKINFKVFFIPNFFVFLQIKNMKHIECDFVLMPRSCTTDGT